MMWGLVGGVACFAVLILAVLGGALVLIASSPPKIVTPRDVFGFAKRDTRAAGEHPAIERYPTRDGSQLAYRFYDSPGERLLVFAHGSSYHGGGYHALASAISSNGAAKVVLPNLRGHYLPGGVAATSIMSGNSRTISRTSSASCAAADSAVLSAWAVIPAAAASRSASRAAATAASCRAICW
jgi:hypothetical protein